MKVLFQTISDSLKRETTVVEYNGHKFKINIWHRNGDTLGFNTNCCLDIMDNDGVWKHLEDCRSLNIGWQNYYYMADGDYHIGNQNDVARHMFFEYIKKVY